MNKTHPYGPFGRAYEGLCRERNLRPLSAIHAYLQEKRLRFCADRVGFEDWSPILNSIAADRSLSEIFIYSRHRRKKVREKINTEEKFEQFRSGRQKGSILHTNYMLRCLIDANAVCIRDSSAMTSVTLDGIPLAPKYLHILCDGLSKSHSLKALSLIRCRIGDAGCDLVLNALQNNPSFYVLNLSACFLTSRSALPLSRFLKKKKTNLLQSVWKEDAGRSYEQPQTQGLHTLILNNNRKLSDAGLRIIMDVLKEDFWVKTLSLRNCGLSKSSGEAVIELLETNSVITTLDLKENDIPSDILQTVSRLLRRRQEKGERIPMNKRLLNWRNNFVKKVDERKNCKKFKEPLITYHSFDQQENVNTRYVKRLLQTTEKRAFSGILLNKSNNKRETHTRRKHKRRGKDPQHAATINNRRHDIIDLKELTVRLSKITGCNTNLLRELKNDQRLLTKEKTYRLKAEEEYLELQPQIDKLRNGIQSQNKINSKILRERQFFKYLQNIFTRLEHFSGKETTFGMVGSLENSPKRAADPVELLQVTNQRNELNTKSSSSLSLSPIARYHYEKKVSKSPQRSRPHCPHRLRL